MHVACVYVITVCLLIIDDMIQCLVMIDNHSYPADEAHAFRGPRHAYA